MKEEKKISKKTVKKPKITSAPEPIVDETVMGPNKMMSLLSELPDTVYWEAILKFINNNDVQAITVLATVDPFKDPTKVARTQGMRTGLYLLREEILKERKLRAIASGEIEKPKENTIQGY